MLPNSVVTFLSSSYLSILHTVSDSINTFYSWLCNITFFLAFHLCLWLSPHQIPSPFSIFIVSENPYEIAWFWHYMYARKFPQLYFLHWYLSKPILVPYIHLSVWYIHIDTDTGSPAFKILHMNLWIPTSHLPHHKMINHVIPRLILYFLFPTITTSHPASTKPQWLSRPQPPKFIVFIYHYSLPSHHYLFYLN